MDDATLLQRIGTGDRAALKALYDRHSGALHHFVRARLSDPFEAADVVQETFLEVWRAADRFEGRAAPRTWLFGIAKNKAVDRHRRAARTEIRAPDETLPDDAPDPALVAERASDAALLRRCIARLAGPQRAAVRLAFYEDMTYAEVAEAEGVPVGTVKTRIHHAKRLLMACLAGDGAAES